MPPTAPPASSHVDFIPTGDVLLRQPTLAYSVEIPVFGIVTRFETNSRRVMELVEASFGDWRCVAGMSNGRVSCMLVQIVVHEGDEGSGSRSRVRHLCPDNRLIAHSAGSVAVCDPDRQLSIAFVTASLVADADHFRTEVLESITFALLAQSDRHPIHAAAISRGSRAVLLAGPSGSGKSTLAYAARSAGLDLLSDDNVRIELGPPFRVWGWPRRLRLLSVSSGLFPELAGGGGALSAKKGKIAFDLGEDARPARHVAEDAVVCVLTRERRPSPELEQLTVGDVVRALSERVEPGFDLYPARHAVVVQALAARGGWRLTLSSDPREALPLLVEMLDHGGGATEPVVQNRSSIASGTPQSPVRTD